MHRVTVSIFGLILVGLMTLSGCATKKFVRHEVGTLEPKIAEVRKESAAAITEVNERVDAVDRRAQAGAAAADQKATAADQKATAALQAAGLADGKAVAADKKADTAVQQFNSRMSTVESRMSSLDSYAAGEPQLIAFKVNSDVLSDEAKQQLSAAADGVASQKTGYMIEIQGFTDATGSELYNVSLSQRRAESVQRYLVSKGLPLYRTSIIGLGEERPVADNESRQGREQNRRVEVRVLQSARAAN